MSQQLPLDPAHPIEIQESLQRFRGDHPDPTRLAFIMMKFGNTAAYRRIGEAIRTTLEPLGIRGLRADDKEYHADLLSNVLTYVYGCGWGIAVFERIETDTFNPNVALEVGYMFALRKPVCLLKDQTLLALQSDLMGRLYRTFDPHDPHGSIPQALSGWFADKGIASPTPLHTPQEVLYPLLFRGGDVQHWTPEHLAAFFENLKRDALEYCRRAYEGSDPVDVDYAVDVVSRANELVDQQVSAYGLKDLFTNYERRGA